MTRVVVYLGLLIGMIHATKAPAQEKPLGWLASRYEVGNRGSETISSGKLPDGSDDPGGKSYGLFQMAARRGLNGSTVQEFVKETYPDDFRKVNTGDPKTKEELTPGTNEFAAKWLEVARREGRNFFLAEQEFISDTYYVPIVSRLKTELGLDLEARSDALRNVIWSVAVQLGPPADPKGQALQLLKKGLVRWDKKELSALYDRKMMKGISDEDLIKAIYAERDRRDKDGGMVWFGGRNIGSRFTLEKKDALAALQAEAELKKSVLDVIGKEVGIAVTPKRVRRPRELTVERGQITFDSEGNEEGPYQSRRPSVPGDRSGVTIGRGYDLGYKTKEQAIRDLIAAGLTKDQAELYAQAAGLTGRAARKFMEDHSRAQLLKAAQAMGLQGVQVNEYIRANTLEILTLQQQRTLFERTYADKESEVRRAFPDFDKYPLPAREALVDMAYNLGTNGLMEKFPTLVKAVRNRDWSTASQECHRRGVGVDRNDAVRRLFVDASRAK